MIVFCKNNYYSYIFMIVCYSRKNQHFHHICCFVCFSYTDKCVVQNLCTNETCSPLFHFTGAAQTAYSTKDTFEYLRPENSNTAEEGLSPFEYMAKDMKDITEDGGVLKKILKHGGGPIVPAGAFVNSKSM